MVGRDSVLRPGSGQVEPRSTLVQPNDATATAATMVGVEVLGHPGVSGIAAAAPWSLGRLPRRSRRAEAGREEIRARPSLALPWDMEERGLTSAATVVNQQLEIENRQFTW